MIEVEDHARRAEVPFPWWRSVAAAAAPGLIIAAVAVVLRDVAFRGMITDQHIDLLGFWLPTHCYLGTSLAHGVLPGWNPHVMAGLPFAADPQSGWLYLPAMVLQTVLACGTALRILVVLQPIVAGLGLYWFLRSERLSPPAATVGGLAIALGIAAARMVSSLPIAGSLAWTAILLALASRSMRASRWSARLGWAGGAAIAWGQLAGAHLSHGLVGGTLLLLGYLLARAIADVRRGDRAWGEAVLGVGSLLALLVPVNMAVLLPRVAYLSRASLGLGYDGLNQLAAQLAGSVPSTSDVGPGAGLSWPVVLGTSPGAYLGAAVLLLSFAGWWSRRHRALLAAFTVGGMVLYVASLEVVARAVAPVARALPMGDFYLHEPGRFRWGMMVVLPVLGAVGVDAWRRAEGVSRRVAMLAVGTFVWGGMLLLTPIPRGWLIVPVVGALVALAVLAGSILRPVVALLIPAALAIELVGGALLGQTARDARRDDGRRLHAGSAFGRLARPDVPVDEYLREGEIVATLRGAPEGRFITPPSQPRRGRRTAGYLSFWSPEDLGLLNKQRAMLFGLEDAQGYNPIQPRHYWMFLRYGHPPGPGHNRAVVQDPSPEDLNLLQVRWLIASVDDPPPGDTALVNREGPWALYEREAPSRATLVTDWEVEPDQQRALERVTGDGFDPDQVVVLDRDPGLERAPDSPVGSASFEWLSSQEALVSVESPGPAVVVIRNTYDPNWEATVDGRPAEVITANAFLQGVAVPAGRHDVRLRFHDRSIGLGLIASGLVLALLIGAVASLRVVERRRRHLPGTEELSRPCAS